MKLYVHYEPSSDGGGAAGAGDKEEGGAALTLKLTLPKKWRGEPVQQVLDLFLESYNAKKKPTTPVDAAGVHMEKAGCVCVPTD